MRIFVIVAQGPKPGDNSLLAQAGLVAEAAFTDSEEAYLYSTMGDMEIHEVVLHQAGEDQ